MASHPVPTQAEIAKIRNNWISVILTKIIVPFYKNKKKDCREKGENIIFFSTGMIGDSIMHIAQMRMIRNTYPKSEITFVGRSVSQEVLKDQRLIDHFIALDKDPSVMGGRNMIRHFFKFKSIMHEINQKIYDIAITDDGTIMQAIILRMVHANRYIGFNIYGTGKMFSDPVELPDKIMHDVDKRIFLLEQTGFIKGDARKIYFNLTEMQKTYGQEFIKKYNLKDFYIIGIHPGASMKTKQWMQYEKLIPFILKKKRTVAIIFEGPGEKDIVDSLFEKISCTKSVIRVSENLEHYIAILGVCHCVICNDSGAGHIAAALGKKTIVIFGYNYPEISSPIGKDVYTLTYNKIECKGCFSNVCKNNFQCLEHILPEDVLKYI